MSLILRHEPKKFGVLLDAEGYTPLNELLQAMNAAHDLSYDITDDDIRNVVENVEPDKKRFSIVGNDIRANYGHSIDGKIQHEEAVPPGTLWHGTNANVEAQIRAEGLKPMSRQYVHLTTDRNLAVRVGMRRGSPIALKIFASIAHSHGIKFYKAYEAFWLVDSLPAEYIAP